MPAVWGTTYAVTTELLPPGRPLLAATVRALPAGLLLVAVAEQLPMGSWWWRAVVLGGLNIGAFFALLFVAAYRLPGGVAAVAGAVQPLLVAGLAVPLLHERLRARTALACLAGLGGVALLVLRADAGVDAVGVAAALGGAGSMAIGVVLSKRWGRLAPALAVAGWQLVAGGLLLLPLTLVLEGGPPASLSAGNLAGYAYLSLIGTAAAYALWFRGIQALPVTDVAVLGLLSPVVATALGWLVLGQDLTAGQAVGAVVVVAALLAAQGRRSAHLGDGRGRHPSDARAGTSHLRHPQAGSRTGNVLRATGTVVTCRSPRSSMTAMTALEVPLDGWSTDDLPDTGFRYEVVDGSLLVSPPPEFGHDVLAMALGDVLRPHLPAGWARLTAPGVHFDLRNYRLPDLVVYRRSALARGRLESSDLLLAVEVVSPSSISNDRVTKPAQYARAGIPHYWRLEQSPLELVVHDLQDGVYREVGRFNEEVVLTNPVSVRFRLPDLLAAG